VDFVTDSLFILFGASGAPMSSPELWQHRQSEGSDVAVRSPAPPDAEQAFSVLSEEWLGELADCQPGGWSPALGGQRGGVDVRGEALIVKSQSWSPLAFAPVVGVVVQPRLVLARGGVGRLLGGWSSRPRR
jgi:hypothetical protein